MSNLGSSLSIWTDSQSIPWSSQYPKEQNLSMTSFLEDEWLCQDQQNIWARVFNNKHNGKHLGIKKFEVVAVFLKTRNPALDWLMEFQVK